MQPILTVDLDRIAYGSAGIATLGGVQHTVLPISAASLQLMRTAKPEDYLDIALTVVARCVLSLSEEQRDTLTPAQIEAIISLATGDVEKVASLDPNADRPATPSLSPV